MSDHETATTCLAPVWDGPYRYRCGMGSAGVCGRHGQRQPHPRDRRTIHRQEDRMTADRPTYDEAAPTVNVERLACRLAEEEGISYMEALLRVQRNRSAFIREVDA